MDPECIQAVALAARAAGLLAAFDVVSPHCDDQDPGFRARLGAMWREVARLISAAADLVDPREAAPGDPLKELFK